MTLGILSTEYVRVPVSRDDGSSPTSDVVQLAFMLSGEPSSGDWHTGSWETVSGIYYARVLVGPAQVVLALGVYTVWIKITDNPEIPVRQAGELVIVT